MKPHLIILTILLCAGVCAAQVSAMTIGIISAMAKEHQQLTQLLTDAKEEQHGNYIFTTGTIGNNNVVLMQCGIGKVNAAVGTTILIEHFTPTCILSTGCAGGIETGMNVMDVVVSSEVAYHDVEIPGCEPGQVQGLPQRFKAEEQLIEAAMSCRGENASPKLHVGLICSGDQFISDSTQLQRIKARFPEALAVDMESAAIAQTCFLMKVPFVSFRVLSDTPGAEGHIDQYLDFWDSMAQSSFDITRRFITSLPDRFALLPFEEE